MIMKMIYDYDYIKSHYRLIAIDFSRQKKIRCSFKSNSRNRICWTIKKLDAYYNEGGNDQSCLTILENNKETRLNFSEGSLRALKNNENLSKDKS